MPKITQLLAWVIEEKPGDEGVPAIGTPSGYIMPLMGADAPAAESVRQQAQQVANHARKPIKLMRSTGLEVVEVLEPQKP